MPWRERSIGAASATGAELVTIGAVISRSLSPTDAAAGAPDVPEPSPSEALRFAATFAPRLAAALGAVPPRVRVATALERDGVPATAELEARLGEDLRRDEADLAARLAQATVRAVDEETVDVATAVDRILRTLDDLLADREVAAAGRAIGALGAAAREEVSPAAAEVCAIVTAALADPPRLARLFALVAPGGPAAPEEASRWLLALSPRAIPVLLDLLDEVEGAPQRAVILEALAVLGRDDPAPIVARLSVAGAARIADLLRLVDRLEPPNRVELLARTMQHPSPDVRREVLVTLARLRTEAARAPVAAALEDPSSEVRAAAARLLVRFGPERALQDLLHAIRGPGFDGRRAAERAAFFLALGETGLPGALSFFQELLDQRGLLGRGKGREAKLLAVSGLAAAPSIGAFRLLQAARGDPDADVAAAAASACTRVRAALVGAGEAR